MNRRDFLALSGTAFLCSAVPGASSALGANTVRSLRMYNVHNNEHIFVPYWVNGRYHRKGLSALNSFFRDWRTNDVKNIDARLFDILYALQQQSPNPNNPIELVSGYRSPKTNAALRKGSSNVAKNSLHPKGMASDIRIRGMRLKTLKDNAVALKKGGVGYYPQQRNNFVHVDTGGVRYW